MTSRTEDCIVMLPTHSRHGSFEMLNLATNKIVTREHFKILPMPQSVIATLNAMAVREGKKITQTKVHVFDELLFANSLDKSNLPTFITNPPTQDAAVDTTEVETPPTLIDLPSADIIFEIPPSELGGGVAPAVDKGSRHSGRTRRNQKFETRDNWGARTGRTYTTTTAHTPVRCGSLRVCYPIQPIRCCFHLSTFVFTATTISH